MLTTKDFAKLHGKFRTEINRLILEGRIKPMPEKFGRAYMFTGKEKIVKVKIGRPKLSEIKGKIK